MLLPGVIAFTLDDVLLKTCMWGLQQVLSIKNTPAQTLGVL